MARVSEIHTKDKVIDFLRVLIVFQTLHPNTLNVHGVDSHSQAFIQTDKHLTYIVGDYSNGIPLEIKPGHSNQDFSQQDDNFFSTIRLDPPLLDFNQQPVGMPRMEKVTVVNSDTKNTLHLISISGSTVHFHCSFFQDKAVPPGGNTTFDVVFLARQVGNVENTLYIRTSLGYLNYQVFGVGVPNPYRLRPYLGARVPVNCSFSPMIEMHNPYSTKLQVLEMFSSEGDLHLELPTGEKEAGKSAWEIQPFETKSVMRANFIARVENNHTAFIRIKTSKESENKLLILPVEVEVSAEPGLYSPVEMIDFGILRTFDEPKSMKIGLINTGTKPIHISSITVSPPNDAISIDFRPSKLPANNQKITTIAHITYKAVKALHPRQWSGKIIIRSKNNQEKLILPYQANVLHGSMVYNINMTYFFSAKALRNITRPLAFTNTFNFSLVIYNVSLSSNVAPYFTILNFVRPMIILPQQTLKAFDLMYHPNATQLHFTTMLTLHTNTSTFSIPIIVYNGLFKVIHHRPEKFKGQLDFGTMGVGESRSMTFTVRNDNPVNVILGEYTSNMNQTIVRILGIEKGNGTTLTRLHNQSDIDTDPLIIKPYHYAVFSVDVIAPYEEGAYAAEVMIVTQFQDLFIPMTLRTAEGSLYAIPEKFIFDRVYPGKTPFKVLQINSTFKNYMEVTQVTFNPADTRFYFIPQNDNVVLLKPGEPNVVGKIYFDSKRECLEDCYVGLPTFTPGGNQWLVGLTLEKEVANTDQYLFTWLQQKWEKIENSEFNIANVTIELDTNEVRGFLFSAQAYLHWPSLVRKTHIKFPLTQIGNISISDVIVENTGDYPVVIQVLPLSLYPSPHTILDLLTNRLSTDISDYIETDDIDTFTLRDLEHINKADNNPMINHRKTVENLLGPTPHPDTLAALLKTGEKLKVKIGFQPRDDVLRTSLIVIRNNLTIIDAVVVQGQGRRGDLRFSTRRPGSVTPLLFEMTEKHLKNCDISEKKSSKLVPHFTVRRTFTLKNTGELPFYVHKFSINDSPCEGFGFKVLDCDGFEMLPNMSRKIDIAFTPDFTMSRIRRSLTVYTSLGPPANYTLQATVPPHLLPKCSAALPRPNWEPVLYYSVLCVMGFFFFCILVAAYFEADRVIVADILRRKLKINSAAQIFDKGKVFDLNSIAGLSALHPKPIPQPQTVEIKQPLPARILEPNGHVEYRRAQREPLFSSIFSILKNLIPRKIFRRSSRKVDRQASKEKEVKSTSSQSGAKQQTNEKDKSSNNNNSNDNTDKNKLRKSKYNKKQEDNNEKKIRSDYYNDPIEDYITDMMDKEEFIPNRSNVKSRSKKKRGKNNDILRTVGLKDISSVISDDRDEISSTTTDSSNGDNDEKTYSARDSTPEPPVITSSKSKRLKVKVATSVDVLDDFSGEGEFLLTSRSKAHRKIRVNPNETFGGNILRPSSLELPYSMESKPQKEEKSEENKSKKSSKASKKKGAVYIHTDLTDSEDHGKDSPPPNWDLSNLTPGDLSDLSIQTQDFASKHIKSMNSNGTVNGFSPDSLSSSSRSSSYSSIVSNSSNGNDNKTKRGSNDKRFFNPFAENGLPNLLSKPPLLSPTDKGNNPWTNSTSSPIPIPESIGVNSFGLHTIDENIQSNFMANNVPVGTQPTSEYGYTAPNGIGGIYSNYSSANIESLPQSQQLTMMQQLQVERRRRTQEHQMRMLHQGVGWPGFDAPPVRSDSLWDSPLDATAWSSNTDSPPNSNPGGFWNTISNSASSGWNSFASIWGNTPSTSAAPTIPTDSIVNDGTNPNSPSVPITSSGSFNPFGPVQAIWAPGSTQTGTSNWGQFAANPEEEEQKQ
ncbi:hypothetical protein LOTGIDRAFT_228573 [Lottia gigantea]|uniref:Uncharacterized protein n=1 Tax=Lottia gigantea TaxID=225164 RepID=V3ZQW1_LOTGI|nr:hypothetical protein LOTGIDRAFT_228573 [Lottia gigantea]ESO93808.1 hypothetical protein LOTGIDRAFT_228573 [Lottia gigantea]